MTSEHNAFLIPFTDLALTGIIGLPVPQRGTWPVLGILAVAIMAGIVASPIDASLAPAPRMKTNWAGAWNRHTPALRR